MLKPPDFSLRPQNKHRPGFSLVELLVTMVILGLILGSVSSGLDDLRKFSREYLRQTIFETPYLIFLLKLEEDYQEAEINISADGGNLDNMRFYKDVNWDGDYGDDDNEDDDKAERIEYKWNKSEERIDRKNRKSESSKFQAFLEGIDGFEWKKISAQGDAACHQMKIKPTLSKKHRIIKYCREH